MQIRETVLENGFRIITEEVNHSQSVAINVWAKVGSRFENKKEMGISHFLEHMAFKGTESKNAFEIAKIFDDMGGNLNAYTSRESTVYHTKVLKEDVKVAVEVLADIVINSNFPEEEIKREKGVILQEIHQVNDTPHDIIYDKYMEAAYQDQPLGHSILGTPETIDSFSKQDIKDYVSKHYFADNMMFTAAGNITHDEILSLVSPLFSSLPTRQPNELQKAVYSGGEYRESRKLEQVNLLLGFPGFAYDHKLYYPMTVFSAILGGGMSSRLFQEVREKLGLAYSIYSFHSSYRDTGLFSVCAGTDNGNLPELLSTIITEIKKISKDLKEEEVISAKKRLKASILMSGESNSARAEYLGSSYYRYGCYVSKEEIIAKISAVTKDGVNEVIEYLLSNCTKITLASIGDLNGLPTYDEVVEMLK